MLCDTMNSNNKKSRSDKGKYVTTVKVLKTLCFRD